MSKNPAVVVSSRVRCTRCNRFVFRGATCKCREARAAYVPLVDGTLGPVNNKPLRRQLGGASTLGSPLTARPKWRADHDGNTSSIDGITGAE